MIRSLGFLALIAGLAVAWPAAAPADQDHGNRRDGNVSNRNTNRDHPRGYWLVYYLRHRRSGGKMGTWRALKHPNGHYRTFATQAAAMTEANKINDNKERPPGVPGSIPVEAEACWTADLKHLPKEPQSRPRRHKDRRLRHSLERFEGELRELERMLKR
jgi:hypothetical protein